MQPKNPQQPLIRKKKPQKPPQYKNLTAFKQQQKHYKLYQDQQTDFSKLFNPTQQMFVEVDGYQVCELPFPQGAYYVRNFISNMGVMGIGYFGLNLYWRRPYRTNLDSREELYQSQDKQEGEASMQPEQPQQPDTNNQQTQTKKENDKKIEQIEEEPKNQQCQFYFNQKIRWANVGYQYDWTLRKYPQVKTPMHFSIQQLSDKANKLYNSIQHVKKQYEPESAIVNYYGYKDYMTGHLDDAEIDQESPIYSFSFGLSCIFLMGGRTKQEQPTAIRLNSGDLLIMAGQSRKCYHGVPRILPNTFPEPTPQQQIPCLEHIQNLQQKYSKNVPKQSHNSYNNIKQYLRTHRININIRQVYPRQ